MSTTVNNTARIRAQNDTFRVLGEGHGSILLTQGIQALGELMIIRIILAIREYDAWSEDNDPWNEHDFGSVEISGHTIFFKIDYYDREVRYGSPDPANPEVTHRALTIMLATEY